MVGGHVALDLVNTVEPRVPDRSVGREHLGTAEALLAWSRRVGVVTDEEGERVAAAWAGSALDGPALTAALEIREATYDVLIAALAGAGATALSARRAAATLVRGDQPCHAHPHRRPHLRPAPRGE